MYMYMHMYRYRCICMYIYVYKPTLVLVETACQHFARLLYLNYAYM